jgi:hypothetical protein
MAKMQELHALCALQDSLLQAYRGIFVTAQSVVFAVAANAMLSSPRTTFILAVLGLVMLKTWHDVTRSRAQDVSLAQWLVLLAENASEVDALSVSMRPFSTLKTFQEGQVITRLGRHAWRGTGSTRTVADQQVLVRDADFEASINSATRVYMEKLLPAAFLSLWVVVLYFAVRAASAT